MTSTVGVHRIGNYCYLAASGSVEAATDAISEEWTGAPGKGLVGFGLPPSDRPRLRVAYYAHLLRRAPRKDATTWRSSTSTSRSCSSTGSTSSCADRGSRRGDVCRGLMGSAAARERGAVLD